VPVAGSDLSRPGPRDRDDLAPRGESADGGSQWLGGAVSACPCGAPSAATRSNLRTIKIRH
jgi:hypothetical protein